MASFDVAKEEKLDELNLNILALVAQSVDPPDPPSGNAIIWMSDGTGTGADGDIMFKVTNGAGTTQTTNLITF